MRRHRNFRRRRTDDHDTPGDAGSEGPETSPLADPAVSISPVNFFSIAVDCHRRKEGTKGPLDLSYRMPSLARFCQEEDFATVDLAWAREGLWASVTVDKPFERAFFPEVQSGDSVELFIDTRDSKSSGFNNRFCHHFFFLPEAVDGHIAGEITRFRTEDVHEWCDEKELQVKGHLHSSHYQLDMFIPAHCLHGYDPELFARLGFTYRINRPGEDSQHFAVSSRDYQIEQQPSLWASIRLVP